MYYLFKMRSDGNKNLSHICFSWKLPITNVKFFLLFADNIFWAVPFYGQKVPNFFDSYENTTATHLKMFFANFGLFKQFQAVKNVGKGRKMGIYGL